MRDPARIPRIIETLTDVWGQNDQLRLCQLVVNIAASGNDPFYVEDDVFEERLLAALEEGWPNGQQPRKRDLSYGGSE